MSIVVAMYNIERYINNCLDSCVKQNNTYTDDYEIIIINDGSTDHCEEIANEYCVLYDNVTVISQQNGGLSAARNTGIDKANGEYIWFVDGDDAIAPSAVSFLVSAIRENGSDAFICNFSTFEDDIILETSNLTSYPLMSGKAIHDKYQCLLPMMAWLTVYRTSLLRKNNLYFLPGIYHEDKEFSVRAHHLMDSISFIKEPLYYYRVARNDSIMNTSRRDNTKSLLSEIAIIDSFSDFFSYEDTPFVRKLLGMCATTFMIRRYDSAFVVNETTTRLLKENKKRLYRLMWQAGQWKRRALLIFIITMPTFILSKVMYRIGNRSGLM